MNNNSINITSSGKIIIAVILHFVSYSYVISQNLLDVNYNSIYNRSQGEKQQAILKPNEQLRYACIVNPGNRREAFWTFELMKKAFDTGEYKTLYIDMPALEAMMLDNYVKNRAWMTADMVKTYCAYSYRRWISADDTNVMSFLNWVKQFNISHDAKISIRGLDYHSGEEATLSLMKVYPAIEGVIDSLRQLFWDADRINQYTLVEHTKNVLETNEHSIRNIVGEDYDVFMQFCNQYHYDSVISQHKRDSLMFNSLLYIDESDIQPSKAIIFMNVWSLRLEQGVITFRTRIMNWLKRDEYLFYNLIDDINTQK